jgi:dTDP-4-dehydrorhamnose 3,5-epimerase
MTASGLRVSETSIPGLLLIEPPVFSDERGDFFETYVRSKYAANAIGEDFQQDDVSWSKKNVLRGLHGDTRMVKIVQCLAGDIFDVIVDARRDSAAFGKWQSFELSQNNRHQLYVPAGCLHGFLVRSEHALMAYKHSVEYDPATEISARWDDPDLHIPWPIDGSPRLSQKDRNNGLFRDIPAARLAAE